MPILYDAQNNPIDFSSPTTEELATEFATRLSAGADLGSFLGWLPDPDPVLLKRGELASVLDDLTADDQVCMAMQSRKLRVLNAQDYDFAPGQAKGKDVAPDAAALCDALVADLEPIALRDVFSTMLDAPFYGFTPLELLWEPQGGRLRLKGIVAKPRDWFCFDEHNRPMFRGEWGTPRPLPPNKFVFVRHFPTYENPYGLRLLSRCLWPVAFKRGGIEFLTRFVEKFGMPWILAKAPRNADRRDRMAMAADLAGMVQDAVAVLPNGADVELASAQGKAGDLHEGYLRRWDKAISKVLMGQTLTAEMDGQGGSRAASETHYSVSEDMAEADQFLVASAMNEIALAYRNVNAPAGVIAPVFAYSEPEDYAAQADLDTQLHGVGVRFAKSHFTRRYGLAEDEFELATDESAPAGQAEFAERGEHAEATHAAQGVVDRAISDILPEAVRANGALTSQIEKAVRRAEGWEDMQILLAELLGRDADGGELEELLARIMANAGAYGRAAVREES